jgi:N-methylhydantoinase B
MFAIQRGDELIRIPAATNIAVQKGDKVVIQTSGGGGYGDPAARDRDAVRRDLREGRISAEAARSVYGL